MKKQIISPDVIKVSWADWLLCFLAVFITSILLGNLGHYTEQMQFDEPAYTNPQIIGSLSLENLDIFFTPVALNRHWVTMFSLATNYACGAQYDYSIYREWNLIFHLMGVFWFFWFSKFLFKETVPAFLIALTFGIATMHVESVASVAQRKDVLMGMFSGLALFLYVYGIRKSKETSPFYLSFIVLIFILALQSKAMAVMFPVAVIVINWYLKRNLLGNNMPEKVFIITCFILSFIIGIDTYYIQRGGIEYASISNFAGNPILAKIQYPLYGLSHYIVGYFFPSSGSIFYLAPKSIPWTGIGALIITGTIIWKFWRIREIKLMVLFSLIYVILVLQILRVGQAVAADRYTYLFYVGVSFFWVPIYRYWKESKNVWTIGIPILCIVHFAIIGTKTHQQVQLWENNEKILLASLKENPNNRIVLVNLGVYYYSVAGHFGAKGNTPLSDDFTNKAIRCFEKVIELGAIDRRPFTNLASILYFYKKDYRYALQNCDSALNYEDSLSLMLIIRGNIHFKLGSYQLAERDLEKASRLTLVDKNFKEGLYSTLGKVYMIRNKDSLAIEMFKKALILNKNLLNVTVDLAILYESQNDSRNALAYLQKSQALGGNIQMNSIKEMANLRKVTPAH